MILKIGLVAALFSLAFSALAVFLLGLIPVLHTSRLGLFIVLSLVGTAVLLNGTFNPKSSLFGRTFWRGSKNLKAISLTFDDGPNEPYTSQILDILQEFGIKATFFIVGQNAEFYPDALRREAKAGHEIGAHTYDHGVLPLKSPRGIRNQIAKSMKAIQDIAGLKPHFLRVPHGWRNLWVSPVAEKEGLTTVAWTFGVWDTDRPGTSQIVWRVLKRLKNGSILLLHDGKGTEHGTDSSQLVAALPVIIKEARKRGYQFLALSEMMAETGKK